MRRLIVNADDFGFTRGVNRAVIEAHLAGTVTSATLMAEATEFDEAVSLAKSVPSLKVGCHVVLIGGTPLLPAKEVPSLLTPDGCLRSGWGEFAAAALGGRLAAKEIEAEATAQICKLQAAGIPVTHVDTHKHVHIFPQVLRPLLRAAATCGIRAVRSPFEPARLALLGERFSLWQRWASVRMLSVMHGAFRRIVRDSGMLSPEGTLGIVATGSWDPAVFRYLIQHVPEGTWELVCHPGYDDAQLRTMPTRLAASRERELQILTSPESLPMLERYGIHLATYQDLGGS